MLNFPGLRGPADVRGVGPHAGAPGPSKEKERDEERSCYNHQYIHTFHTVPAPFFSSSRWASQGAEQLILKWDHIHIKLGESELSQTDSEVCKYETTSLVLLCVRRKLRSV